MTKLIRYSNNRSSNVTQLAKRIHEVFKWQPLATPWRHSHESNVPTTLDGCRHACIEPARSSSATVPERLNSSVRKLDSVYILRRSLEGRNPSYVIFLVRCRRVLNSRCLRSRRPPTSFLLLSLRVHCHLGDRSAAALVQRSIASVKECAWYRA